jgi:tetratricopeptide (TPR) repeat protein
MQRKFLALSFAPLFVLCTLIHTQAEAKITPKVSAQNTQSAKHSQTIAPEEPDDSAAIATAAPAEMSENNSPEAQALNQKISNSNDWYEKSYAAYEDKKYAKALEYIQKAIALYPDYSSYYDLKAYIYIELKDFNNAVKAADAGLELAEDDPSFYEIKANCLHELKKTDQALAAYRKMFEFRNNFDGNPEGSWFYNYIYVLSEEKLSDEVIKVYAVLLKSMNDGEEIEDIESHAGDIHFYASIAFNRKGDSVAEMTALNEAIKASPDFSGYYNNRGNLFNDLKKYTEALADFNKGISLDKKSSSLYYNRGHTYIMIENYESALKNFLEAEKLGMTDDKVYLMMGNAHKGLKQYEKALAAYQKVLVINPANKEVQNNIATLYKLMGKPELSSAAYQQASTAQRPEIPLYNQANDLVEQEKCKDAMPLIKKALAIKPDFADALNLLGVCHIKAKQFDAAVETLSKAIKLNETDWVFYMNRATAYKNLDQFELAQSDYLRVLKLNPGQTAAYYTLAKLYEKQDNIESANQYYKLADESGFSEIEYYVDYSAFLLANNRAKDAVSLLVKATKRYPNDYQLLVNLANAYDETGDENKSEASLKKAMTINPNNASVYYNLGNFYYLKKKDLTQAENYYLKAIEKDPEIFIAYLNLASVQAGLGKKAQAFSVYKTLMTKNPKNYEAYYNRGAYYVELGMNSEAIADFEKSFGLMDEALKNQKNNAYELSKLQSKNSLLKAQAYQLMGRYDTAATAYEAYIKFNTNDAVAYSNYAYCLIETGSLQKALLNLEKAYQLNKNDIDSVIGLIAVNYLLNNKAGVSKYKSVVKRDFSDYRLNAGMLDELSKYGYAYTDTFKRIWNDMMSK